MKAELEELKNEYLEKFTAYAKSAEIIEKVDNEMYSKLIEKAAGCKLMLDAVKQKLSLFK